MIKLETVCAAGTCVLLGGAPSAAVTFEMMTELRQEQCLNQCAVLPRDALHVQHPEEGSTATGSLSAMHSYTAIVMGPPTPPVLRPIFSAWQQDNWQNPHPGPRRGAWLAAMATEETPLQLRAAST